RRARCTNRGCSFTSQVDVMLPSCRVKTVASKRVQSIDLWDKRGAQLAPSRDQSSASESLPVFTADDPVAGFVITYRRVHSVRIGNVLVQTELICQGLEITEQFFMTRVHFRNVKVKEVAKAVNHR